MSSTKTPKSRNSPTAHASKKSVGTIAVGNDGYKYIVAGRNNDTHYWKKLGLNRKAPNEHAAKQKIGTVTTGNDGYLYMVAGRKNKSQYWKKLALAKDFTRPIPPPITKNSINIWVGEVANIDEDDLPQEKNNGNKPFRTGWLGVGNIWVTPKFIKILRRPPRIATCDPGIDAGWHNAYVFGKLFSSNYYYIGGHGNDLAQTGIVQLTGLTEDDIDKFSRNQHIDGRKRRYDPWDVVYKDINYDWDNVNALKQIRKSVSDNILFVGTTAGGDVGADIFAHFDKSGNIDSIIINNGCLFSFLNKGWAVDKHGVFRLASAEDK